MDVQWEISTNKHRVTTLEGGVVYEGETIYGWDFEAQELRWWYFNSTGGHVIGNIVEEDKGYLVAEGINHGPGTQTPAPKTKEAQHHFAALVGHV